MPFNFDDHTKQEHLDHFGGGDCAVCAPDNHLEDAVYVTIPLTDISPEVGRLLFGEENYFDVSDS